MAPKRRGRPKKVVTGGSRRDAALEAMRLYGFEDDLIRTTLDELLEVYDDGWLFIEDSSYYVLRETLLEKLNPTTENGGQVELEARDFDLENGGAVTETEVGAVDSGNMEKAIIIQSSVENAGVQEELVAEEAGDEGTMAWKHAPVGVASVMQSKRTTVGDLVVSTEADDGGPITCLADTGAAGPSSMVLSCYELNGTSEDGSNEISIEPLSVVPCSKGNDANPFGDGVELQHDKPPESLDEHAPNSKPSNCGQSSGFKVVDLGEHDQNGSIHPRSSMLPPSAPLRRRLRREHKPCYGWLDDDESDEEDYKENHILQLEPAPLLGNFQHSPQRRRIQLEQSKVVSSSDEGGPVGYIIMDTSAVAPSSLILRDSNASATDLFSFGGVKLQCNKSLKPSSRNAFANPLPAEDGESSGSKDMDLEDDDCFDSKRPSTALMMTTTTNSYI